MEVVIVGNNELKCSCDDHGPLFLVASRNFLFLVDMATARIVHSLDLSPSGWNPFADNRFAEPVTQLACSEDGGYVVLALKFGGLFSCGFKSRPDWSKLSQEVFHQLSASQHFFLACSTQQIYSCGDGAHGELGLGKVVTTSKLTPLQLPPNETPRYISAGRCHCAIITAPDGYLYTFGCGAYCRLGIATPSYPSCVNHNELVNDLNLFIPTRVTALEGVGMLLPNGRTTGLSMCSCGSWHTIAVAGDTGDVFGWGWNKFAQIGGGETPEIVRLPQRIAELGGAAFINNDIGGEDDSGNGRGHEEIVSVTCGSRHSALLTRTGRVFVLGMLGAGQAHELSESVTLHHRSDLAAREMSSPHTESSTVTKEESHTQKAVQICSYGWSLAILYSSERQ